MAILAHISSDLGLPIIVVPKNPPQAEGRVKVPRLTAGAEGAANGDLVPVSISDRPPDA